jgi:hypothetical protein
LFISTSIFQYVLLLVVSVVEAVFDSRIEDIRWLGPKFKTVICRTKNGGFYRSLDSGKNWIDARELLKNTSKKAKPVQ